MRPRTATALLTGVAVGGHHHPAVRGVGVDLDAVLGAYEVLAGAH